jgi:hypothetical protein
MSGSEGDGVEIIEIIGLQWAQVKEVSLKGWLEIEGHRERAV